MFGKFIKITSLLSIVLAILVYKDIVNLDFIFDNTTYTSTDQIPVAEKMASSSDKPAAAGIYSFTYLDIKGNEVSMEKYKGHVIIIVNVASKCGFTDTNYKQLQELYEKYEPKGLRIIGFPCNQFGGQEPGTEEDVCSFATNKYKVTFDMASKVNVNGGDTHPLYGFLKEKQGGLLGKFLKWNFTKFVVNKKGEVVARHSPNTAPKDFEKDIERLLDE